MLTIPADRINGPGEVLFAPHRPYLFIKHYHTIDVWGWENGRLLKQIPEGETDHMAVSPDGSLLACCWGWINNQNTVAVYDLHEDAHHPKPLATESMLAITFSPDGRHLVGGGTRATDGKDIEGVAVIQIWDARTLQLREVIELGEEDEGVWAVCFSPSGDYFACSIAKSDHFASRPGFQQSCSRLRLWQVDNYPSSSGV